MKSYSRYTRRSRMNKTRGVKGTRRKCPEGYIYRKSYVRSFKNTVRQKGYSVHKKGGITYRIFPKASRVVVRGQCVKDKGLPGKGPQLFGKLRRGELIKYGYTYRLAEQFRHNALKKAIAEYDALKVFHKLDAVAKLTKRTSHKAHSIFAKDRDWIRSTYLTRNN
jgi:hypothetical protein